MIAANKTLLVLLLTHLRIALTPLEFSSFRCVWAGLMPFLSVPRETCVLIHSYRYLPNCPDCPCACAQLTSLQSDGLQMTND